MSLFPNAKLCHLDMGPSRRGLGHLGMPLERSLRSWLHSLFCFQVVMRWVICSAVCFFVTCPLITSHRQTSTESKPLLFRLSTPGVCHYSENRMTTVPPGHLEDTHPSSPACHPNSSLVLMLSCKSWVVKVAGDICSHSHVISSMCRVTPKFSNCSEFP